VGERGWGEGQRRHCPTRTGFGTASAMAVVSSPCGMDFFYWMYGAARRGGLLSLLVQRKKQRNTPQAARPALRSGSAGGPGIFVWHIPVPYENAVIHDGALRVLPGPLAVPHGDPEEPGQRRARRISPRELWGPLGPAVPAGKTRRAAHKDVCRFRPGQDAPPENSRRDCAPAA